MMILWKNLSLWYLNCLHRRPVLTEMTTSGVLWGAGDILAQRIDHQDEQHTSIDWKRTGIQVVYASCVWAPFSHHWYKLLDQVAVHAVRSVTTHAARRPLFLATKLALEVVALHPISLVAFFTFVGMSNGDSWQTCYRQLQLDLLPTLALEVAMWTPLDVANFAFVPVRHQLLVVNCGCFFESVALSFIKKHGVFRTPENEMSSRAVGKND